MNSLEELKKELELQGIDTLLYGKGEVKSLEKLWQEVNDPKEACSLLYESDKLVRVVNLVNIHVVHQHRGDLLQLREVLQVFNDGRFRARPNRQAAVSEKCHTDEDLWAAVYRALREALGIVYPEYFNDNDCITQIARNFVTTSSQSYPGLKSEYRIEYFLYHMSEENFCPEGYVEVQRDKKTYFIWEKV